MQSMSSDDTDCGRVDFYEHSDTGNRLVTLGGRRPRRSPPGRAHSTRTMPTFELAAGEPGDELERRIDQGDYEACSSTFTPEINDGRSRPVCRGDPRRICNPTSPTGDSRSRPIEPPETTITEGPHYSWDFQKPDEYRRPAFYFQTSEQTGHLECRFDDDRSTSGIEYRAEAVDRRRIAPDEPLGATGSTHTRSVRWTATETLRDTGPPDFTVYHYNGDSSSSFLNPGVLGSLRSARRGGLAPVVRCSEGLPGRRPRSRSAPSRRAEPGSIKFGEGDRRSRVSTRRPIAVEPSSAQSGRCGRPSGSRCRIELIASPSDGDGGRAKLTRIEAALEAALTAAADAGHPSGWIRRATMRFSRTDSTRIV